MVIVIEVAVPRAIIDMAVPQGVIEVAVLQAVKEVVAQQAVIRAEVQLVATGVAALQAVKEVEALQAATEVAVPEVIQGVVKTLERWVQWTAKKMKTIMTKAVTMVTVTRRRERVSSLQTSAAQVTPGTLLDRVVSMGETPTKRAFNSQHVPETSVTNNDGLVDSIRHLLFTEKFTKPFTT